MQNFKFNIFYQIIANILRSLHGSEHDWSGSFTSTSSQGRTTKLGFETTHFLKPHWHAYFIALNWSVKEEPGLLKYKQGVSTTIEIRLDSCCILRARLLSSAAVLCNQNLINCRHKPHYTCSGEIFSPQISKYAQKGVYWTAPASHRATWKTIRPTGLSFLM